MGPDRLLGSQSFEAVREDCGELKRVIEDGPVGQEPLLEHLILAVLFLGARCRCFVDVLERLRQVLSDVVPHVAVADWYALVSYPIGGCHRPDRFHRRSCFHHIY